MLSKWKFAFFGLCAVALVVGCSSGGEAEVNELGFKDVTVGNKDASVHVVEYASATCPACAFFHNTIMPTLKENYIEPGKVKFTFREFPLDSMATLGFFVARCAPEGRYMNVIESQFAALASGALSGSTALEAYTAFAAEQGIPEERFQACLADESILANMRAMRDHGVDVDNVTGTPTLIINGKKYEGPLTLEDISAELDKALAAN